MKIFNLSLHRTGTQSFHELCRDNGLRSQHWPGLGFTGCCSDALKSFDIQAVWNSYRPLVDQADAFSDLPCPTVYAQAYRDFPDAKFILVIRTPSQWIKSVRKHTRYRTLDVLEKFMYWSICTEKHEYLRKYSDIELEAAYMRHLIDVGAFMRSHKADFAVFQLDSSTFDDALIKFLNFNRDIPIRRVDDNKDDGSDSLRGHLRRILKLDRPRALQS